jgi:hypothetical protein
MLGNNVIALYAKKKKATPMKQVVIASPNDGASTA